MGHSHQCLLFSRIQIGENCIECLDCHMSGFSLFIEHKKYSSVPQLYDAWKKPDKAAGWREKLKPNPAGNSPAKP